MSVITEVTERTQRSVRKAVLLDNAVLVKLTFRSYGTSRKVSTSQVEVGAADKRLLKVSKKILDSPECDAITKLDGQIRTWVYSQVLPSQFIDGCHFVPLVSVERINDRLEDYRAERDVAVTVLCDALERLIEQDRERLGPLFNAGDYPTVEEIQRAYSLEWSYMALDAPKSLQAVSEEMYLAAKQKMELNIAEATDAVRSVLRAQFKELVDHLVDRLTPAPDGTKKIFRNSLTENVNAFLDSFGDRNITEDAELARLVEDARKLLGGEDAESLRSQDYVREAVRSGFSQVQDKLDELIVNEPTRRILVDELPEE